MMRYPNVFAPLRIGSVTVKNRIELAPTVPRLASPEGLVTRELIEYYRAAARGGAGIVTVGETPIDQEYANGFTARSGVGEYRAPLNLGSDRIIPGLSVLVEAVHRYGAVLSIELCHRGLLRIHGGEAIGPSAVSVGGSKVRVIEMDQAMIDRVAENFAVAAERCAKAGMQMIMLHGGHGHLLSQFLSPYTNKRTDKYGGSLENRARFALEVLDAIRKRVGNTLAIEYRLSADELVPGGLRPEEVIEFAKMIQDKVDIIHVSVGHYGEPSTKANMIQPPYLPHALNVHYAERFKKALSIPVATVGSIMDLETADRIIGEGKADLVAMARAIIADRDIVNKSRRGQAADVRPCVRCLKCLKFVPIRCTVNPTVGREVEYPEIAPARKKKKVVIVGGGPAGMQAAVTACAGGHEVVLLEKTSRLGGNLSLAAALPFKQDMRRYLQWLVDQVMKQRGVFVRLNCEATPEIVAAERPDAVVVAVGADPIIPDIPGIELPHVAWVGDILSGNKEVRGDEVVIVGGGLTGCEAALYLAQMGKRVTVADMLELAQIGADAPWGLLDLLKQQEVRLVAEAKLESITSTGAYFSDRTGNQIEIPAETVILSLGFLPRRRVVDAFRCLEGDIDVHVVGDCRVPQDLKQAIHDGFNVAVEI